MCGRGREGGVSYSCGNEDILGEENPLELDDEEVD
jgi:hypothetical protein